MLCLTLLSLFSVFVPFVFSSVVELTKTDFQTNIDEFSCSLVMFYAPWCGHCKAFKPSFEKAAETLANELPEAKLARIDCTTNEETCTKHEIRGYPTIKLFKKGKYVDEYKSARSDDAVISYLKSKCKPPSRLIESEEQLNKLKMHYSPVVLTYTKDTTDPQLSVVQNIASKIGDGIEFTHTHDPKFLGATESKAIGLFRPLLFHTKMEEDIVIYAGDYSAEDVEKWISRHAFGLVGYRTPSNKGNFPKENLLVLYNNASFDNYIQGVKYFRNRMIMALANESSDLTGAYSFSEDFLTELYELGYTNTEDLPMVVIYAGKDTYLMEKYNKPSSITDFIKKYKSGTLKPFDREAQSKKVEL